MQKYKKNGSLLNINTFETLDKVDLELMHIVEKNIELEKRLSVARSESKNIGFVATMGALHGGHIALMERAKRENDILVVTIFVNPAQFNNPSDFKEYPKTINKDIQKLEQVGCDILFHPSVEQIYPVGVNLIAVDFKGMDEVMEGEFRPGHFLGMVTVVDRFFEIIKPTKSYFGEKDFQQYLIVRQLAVERHPNVEVIPCAIVRDESGFAMSSRNLRLSKKGYELALNIPKSLKKVRDLRLSMLPVDIEAYIKDKFNKIEGIHLEYFKIVNAETLTTSVDWAQPKHRAFIAARVGDVRLIDNMLL